MPGPVVFQHQQHEELEKKRGEASSHIQKISGYNCLRITHNKGPWSRSQSLRTPRQMDLTSNLSACFVTWHGTRARSC